jgi:hypothetical protein
MPGRLAANRRRIPCGLILFIGHYNDYIITYAASLLGRQCFDVPPAGQRALLSPGHVRPIRGFPGGIQPG